MNGRKGRTPQKRHGEPAVVPTIPGVIPAVRRRQSPASHVGKNGRSCAPPMVYTCSCRDSQVMRIDLQAGGRQFDPGWLHFGKGVPRLGLGARAGLALNTSTAMGVHSTGPFESPAAASVSSDPSGRVIPQAPAHPVVALPRLGHVFELPASCPHGNAYKQTITTRTRVNQ